MNKKEQREKFIDIMAKFTAYTGKHLPDDVYAKLKELREKEDTTIATIIYDAMFEDIRNVYTSRIFTIIDEEPLY